MRLPVIHHPDYQAPLHDGHTFPMSKYGYLREVLVERGLTAPGDWLTPAPATEAMFARAHDPAYVARVFAGTLSREEERRIGYPQSDRVTRRSRLASAGTLIAARFALETGLACNTAGGSHHARFEHGAGFCVFNDVAVAIRALQREGGLGPVAVIDCDVHQGDGTAAIFGDDPGVFTASLHARGNYPFEKEAGDLDIALPDGSGDADYLAALDALLGRVAREGPFSLAFYNAGVDVHADDRLGRLTLTDDGIRARDRRVTGWARGRGLPLACVLGGGYDRDRRRLAGRHAILFEEATAALDRPAKPA